MPLHVFFPCFGTKNVPFLERESCIRHGVTLVYTSSVRQAIRESLYYGGSFFRENNENFVGTLETVRDIEVSVLERCPYREVRL